MKYTSFINDFSEDLQRITAFYQPRYKGVFNEETVKNTSIICLATEGDEVVGAVRAITDFSRHALIVDLVVDEKFRSQGVGRNLMKNIVFELKKFNIHLISLATDPKYPSLVEFYKKCGFKPLENSTYMTSSN